MASQSWKKQKDFTPDEIIERLHGFTQMKDIKDLVIGMQIRYLSPNKTTQKQTLKMGGVLLFIDQQGRYIRIKSLIGGNTKPWSVQLVNSEIYYKDKNAGTKQYQTLIEWAGTEEDLTHLMDMMGGSRDLGKNIRYIRENYENKLSNLIISNRKLLEQYANMQKSYKKYKARCKQLTEKLTMTGGMSYPDTEF